MTGTIRPISVARSPMLTWANRGATIALAFVLVALGLGVGLRLAGLTALVDYSGSMQPRIAAGDIVVDHGTKAANLRPGQIATIHDPALDRLITHRVLSVERNGRHVVVITRGDANTASESWSLTPQTRVGRMTARIPAAGNVVLWLTAPALRLGLAAIGLALLIAAAYRRLRSTA